MMNRGLSNHIPLWRRLERLALLLAFPCAALALEPNLTLWDTGAPVSGSVDQAQRSAWRRVPTDIFQLESDPSKASSDPGYYGREYAFQGDAAVENQKLLALFQSSAGQVLLFSKDGGAGDAPAKIAAIKPLGFAHASIRRCEVIRNAGDEVVLEARISADDREAVPVLFSFGRNEIIEIKPDSRMSGLSIRAPIEYGVVPSFIGDDLIFNFSEPDQPPKLALPADNLFLGLLKGENQQLVLTWPRGEQRLHIESGGAGAPSVVSLDFQTDGQPLFLAPLSAPGIWHKEDLSSAYLEKDVASDWKRPFPARWQTQLSEAGVKTRFAFRPAKGTVWRGVPGSYDYPVWFQDGAAFFHLGKKVPPKGESIIYFLEGENTPASVLTPVDILQSTLGRIESAPILDVAGRKLRTHHRRGADGVRRACTCGCTEAIQSVFEKGEETQRRDYIEQAIGDMTFFVECHVERIDEYRAFSREIRQFLAAQANASAELKPALEDLSAIAERIEQEYEVQQENMKSLKYAAELAAKTMALTSRTDPQNLPAYMDLLKAWRGMGGAQDYVVAQCHMITRQLFQEAGLAAASDDRLLTTAREIRNRCRKILRQPDGYEIWPNY